MHYECVHSCRSNPVNPLQTFFGEIFFQEKREGGKSSEGKFPPIKLVTFVQSNGGKEGMEN
jgi:hypothetical protein